MLTSIPTRAMKKAGKIAPAQTPIPKTPPAPPPSPNGGAAEGPPRGGGYIRDKVSYAMAVDPTLTYPT